MDERAKSGLAGLRVLSLESRRAAEMAKLIENYGGRAIVAPSMREVPLESNTEALAFARTLASGSFDMVIFLTGVGTRALARVVETIYPVEQFAAALKKITVVARGPKPVAALKELAVPVTIAVPEPNTWREILHLLDAKKVPVKGRMVAVQEHGIPSPQLIEGLQLRGAATLTVHVYNWALPDDLAPLKNAIATLQNDRVDVVLFTAAVQVHHLMQVAEQMNVRDALVAALGRCMVGSIGPVTSEALAEYGIRMHFEPTHPKMGFLVKEAAERAA